MCPVLLNEACGRDDVHALIHEERDREVNHALTLDECEGVMCPALLNDAWDRDDDHALIQASLCSPSFVSLLSLTCLRLSS